MLPMCEIKFQKVSAFFLGYVLAVYTNINIRAHCNQILSPKSHGMCHNLSKNPSWQVLVKSTIAKPFSAPLWPMSQMTFNLIWASFMSLFHSEQMAKLSKVLWVKICFPNSRVSFVRSFHVNVSYQGFKLKTQKIFGSSWSLKQTTWYCVELGRGNRGAVCIVNNWCPEQAHWNPNILNNSQYF